MAYAGAGRSSAPSITGIARRRFRSPEATDSRPQLGNAVRWTWINRRRDKGAGVGAWQTASHGRAARQRLVTGAQAKGDVDKFSHS